MCGDLLGALFLRGHEARVRRQLLGLALGLLGLRADRGGFSACGS